MTSISGVIPNVIGGISQQPPSARLENTAGDLKNAIPSVVSGLRKRPPFQYIDDLTTEPTSSIYQFELEREGKPTKFVVVSDGTIQVFNEDGVSEPVTVVGAAASYITVPDPELDLGMMAIADTMFIYNKRQEVASSVPADGRWDPDDAITFVVENTAASQNFTININGVVVTYTTGTAAPATTDIASQLATLFNAHGGRGAMVAHRRGNSVCVRLNGVVVTSNYDSAPASLVRVYKESIQLFTRLPPYELHGRLVKVQGNPEDTDGSYWVEFDENKKTWSEVVGYQEGQDLTATTMPHELQDDGDGTWTFTASSWNGRGVGDDGSNTGPSFIGRTIQDMFLTANRLILLSDENIIGSEIGFYHNFYRTTCTTLLDSDRLDLAALNTDNRATLLYHGIEFDGGLLLFSDKAQYWMDTSDGMSPASVNIKPTTNYNCAINTAPVKIGTNVLFVDDASNSSWADLREYMIDKVISVNSSEIITKQVPEFIPSGVYKMVTNSTLGMSLVFSRANRNRVYVYNYFNSDGERLQSAWSYWEDENVEFISGYFVGNLLFMTMLRDGKLVLTQMNLQETIEGDFDGLEVQLDQRTLTPSTVFDGTNTTVTLPYNSLSDEEYVAVITVDGVDTAGTAYVADSSVGDQVVFLNVDLTAETFLIGKKYTFMYDVSPIFLRDDGKVPIQDGRLQIRYISILYHQTSYFRVEVTPPGRDTYTSVYAGRTLGRLTDIVGEVAVDNGEFRVSASGEASRNSIKIINDSPFNCRFSSIEWEGSWRPRTHRMK
mgnify:CR=1 FL=1